MYSIQILSMKVHVRRSAKSRVNQSCPVISRMETEGWAGPFKLFTTQAECDAIVREAQRVGRLSTRKGLHMNSPMIRNLASHPEIIKLLQPILGDTFFLWGSHLISSMPGHKHRFHLDIEFAKIKGVTVWIGLKNLSEKTSLKLISHTSELSQSPQELNLNDLELEKAAQEIDPRCKLQTLHAKNGEFVIWKDRTWHSTENVSLTIRNSIILQYSRDEIPCIPESYDFPLKMSTTQFASIPIYASSSAV